MNQYVWWHCNTPFYQRVEVITMSQRTFSTFSNSYILLILIIPHFSGNAQHHSSYIHFETIHSRKVKFCCENTENFFDSSSTLFSREQLNPVNSEANWNCFYAKQCVHLLVEPLSPLQYALWLHLVGTAKLNSFLQLALKRIQHSPILRTINDNCNTVFIFKEIWTNDYFGRCTTPNSTLKWP